MRVVKMGVTETYKKSVTSKLKELLFHRIYILQWLPKYNKVDFISDLIAGITIGLTMMPQSIAYASLAELTAQYGLYSAFMGSIIYVFFGTIKEVSIGPTSLMALLSVSYTHDLPVDFIILLAFLAGCVEFIMGVLKLGFIVDFISAPVVSGFTSATSVIIIGTQLKGLFGLQFRANGFVNTLRMLAVHIYDIKLADTIVGVSSIVFLLSFRQLKDLPVKSKGVKKLLWFLSTGRNAIIVIICSTVAFYYHTTNNGVVPFRLSGTVPSGLPKFSFPNTTTTIGNETYTFVEMCQKLGTGIILVPLVAVLANVAIAKAFASGKMVDASQEMMTLGLCNIFGSFVQAMPTCGAFTRSAVSNASGVRTPLAGLYSGSLIILALTFLTPYFYYIPRATLSAVLISAVIFMIDYHIIKPLWNTNKFDLFITFATFITSLWKGVETGLLIGVIINGVALLKIWARPSIQSHVYVVGSNKYILIKPEVGLLFPAVDTVRQSVCKIANRLGQDKLPILIDCTGLLRVDYTALKGIENLIKTFDTKTQLLLFLNVSPAVLEKLQKSMTIDTYQFCRDMQEATEKMFGIATKDDDSNVHEPLLKDYDPRCFHRPKDRKFSLYDNIHLCNELINNNKTNDDCKNTT